MANEKVELKEAIKKAENNLYKISNQFEEIKKANEMMKEIYDNILLMEKITEENPTLTSIVSNAIKEKKLVSLFKKMQEDFIPIKEKVNSFEDSETRAKLFLENFRTTRLYEFKDLDSMELFIKQAYPLFSISRINFKPEYVGTIDLQKIAEELKEEPKGNQMINIPTEKLSDLIGIIEKKGLFKNARIENELLKIAVKGENTVAVDSDNTRIRRLDRLCKQFDGICKED